MIHEIVIFSLASKIKSDTVIKCDIMLGDHSTHARWGVSLKFLLKINKDFKVLKKNSKCIVYNDSQQSVQYQCALVHGFRNKRQ